MAATSSDERFVAELAAALRAERLDALVVGMMAAILQGAPMTTQDVDILVRDTPLNWSKLRKVAARLGGSLTKTNVRHVWRISGRPMDIEVDVIFDSLPGGHRFASLKSRRIVIDADGHELALASLPDVIASKAAAGRPKDLAVLPMLRAALSVWKAREREVPYGEPARRRSARQASGRSTKKRGETPRTGAASRTRRPSR